MSAACESSAINYLLICILSLIIFFLVTSILFVCESLYIAVQTEKRRKGHNGTKDQTPKTSEEQEKTSPRERTTSQPSFRTWYENNSKSGGYDVPEGSVKQSQTIKATGQGFPDRLQ